MAKINGKEVALAAGTTVEEYLRDNGYAASRVALEINGEILPRAGYAAAVIKEQDAVEIVSFVGGG